MTFSKDELREIEPTPFDTEIVVKAETLQQLVSMARRSLELEALLNTPKTDEFLEAVRIEAAHQVERWGIESDAGKTPWDWFWLVGYLAQKAAQAASNHGAPTAELEALVARWREAASEEIDNPIVTWRDGVWGRANDLDLALRQARALNLDKAKHHTISTAAALLNWHRALSGEPTPMRPGTDLSESDT